MRNQFQKILYFPLHLTKASELPSKTRKGEKKWFLQFCWLKTPALWLPKSFSQRASALIPQ